ncbi:YugN-like family protein [Paenibacillus sp. CAU 1782]
MHMQNAALTAFCKLLFFLKLCITPPIGGVYYVTAKKALEVVPVRPISSTVEGSTGKFTELQGELQGLGYTLGGNWDYDHGFFDKPMDSANKVWLRVPFQVTDGNVDSEYSENNAIITLGQPFVLKHLYNEGNDPEASIRVAGALFDQFQSPVDPDADVEDRWALRGEELVRQLEAVLAR